MDGNKNDLIENKKPGLLTSSHSYKPFRYPWAFDFWKRQQQVHWMMPWSSLSKMEKRNGCTRETLAALEQKDLSQAATFYQHSRSSN